MTTLTHDDGLAVLDAKMARAMATIDWSRDANDTPEAEMVYADDLLTFCPICGTETQKDADGNDWCEHCTSVALDIQCALLD